MTDAELISKIKHIVGQCQYAPTVFSWNRVNLVAAYCMGVAASDPYADVYVNYTPWTPQFQAGLVMGLFDDTPTGVSIALILYTMKRGNFAPLQRDNFVSGVEILMSDYAIRKLDQILKQKQCVISRTYDTVLQIIQLAKTLNILESANQSMPLDQIERQLKAANESLIPLCNQDVDAHPAAKATLRTLIEQVGAKL